MTSLEKKAKTQLNPQSKRKRALLFYKKKAHAHKKASPVTAELMNKVVDYLTIHK